LTRLVLAAIEEAIKDCNIRLTTSPQRSLRNPSARNPGKEGVRTAIGTGPDTLRCQEPSTLRLPVMELKSVSDALIDR
jgi:hypothetical protein